MNKELIFVADPMCSWCWGFSPVMAKVRAMAEGLADVRVVMGGLRPGTEAVMDDTMRGYIRHHWEEVAAKTGQPFDFGLFERDDFIYNTEPACRAVVVARAIAPGTEHTLFERIQQAFYAANTDVTDPATLRDLAVAEGIDADAFTERFNAPASIEETFNDFTYARRLGVQGFPTIVAHDRDPESYAYLTVGYQPWTALADGLEGWLSD